MSEPSAPSPTAAPGSTVDKPKRPARPPLQRPAPVWASDRDPWERQPGERDRPFVAFVTWRDSGPERSLHELATSAGLDPSTVFRWAHAYYWRERVALYDRHLDDVRRKAYAKEIEDMAKRHAALSNAALGALQAPVAELIKRINARSADLENMPARELFQFVRQAAGPIKDLVAVERVARGVPSDATVTGTVGGQQQAGARSLAEEIDEALRGQGYGAPTGVDPDLADPVDTQRAREPIQDV